MIVLEKNMWKCKNFFVHIPGLNGTSTISFFICCSRFFSSACFVSRIRFLCDIVESFRSFEVHDASLRLLEFALLLSCTNKMTFSSVTAHCKPFNRQQKLQFIFPSFLHKIYFFFDLLAGFRNCCFAFAPLTRTYAAIKMLNLMWCSMLIRVCSLHTYPAYTGQHLPFPVRFWRYSVGGKWEEEMVFRSFSFALFRKMEQKYRKKHFQRNKTKC